ncbi:polysaccharide biosynthesis protein [Leifsonia sp. RAF41]|uniref:polysaccharide biosynthesis protein n=1 Tax=Leifsonia sp. RAF41 TaxID=3233056 RepID=UPI003F9754A0
MDKRILIVGKGTAGSALADDIRRRGGSLAGFVDDRLTGDDVLGTLDDIGEVVRANDVSLVYFAIPSAGGKLLRDVINRLDLDAVEFTMIPRTYDVLSRETVHIDDLTDVDVLDLVGREPVKQDVVSSRAFVSGKKVLVTGAAGSIGSRLVRLLTTLGASVAAVDWWENGIFFLRQELDQGDGRLSFHIADVKNERLMREIMLQEQPEIVFHAAAYKHVPLMQENPREAVNNNVWGSVNMMQLAREAGVANFVYVSTDKAVNPVNVMGATKRLGELMLRSFADTSGTRFNAVRFGNVIESNGSVMQIFRSQISRKQPLTVTHPDVTRFFMTIDEASQLIVQSSLAGHPGDIFVLDMGEPVRILDLAHSLVKAVDPSLEIEIVGLRPGEKMYEELSYGPEEVERTGNSKIFIVRDAADADDAEVAAIRSLMTRSLAYEVGADEVVAELRRLGFSLQ